MVKSSGFQFKQFFIAHDKCAMKVNTDSIILGSIVNAVQCKTVLDLGTGSGLLAIMLAQRTAGDCKITAVELEKNAYLQAIDNINNCPWADKIQLINADIMQLDFIKKFDLIISNPPYFKRGLSSRTKERTLARNIINSHFSWLKQASKWCDYKSSIAFILPIEDGEDLIKQAEQLKLYCIEKLKIITKIGKKPKRIIVIFSHQMTECIESELVIYQNDNKYTSTFKELTKDYYLNIK